MAWPLAVLLAVLAVCVLVLAPPVGVIVTARDGALRVRLRALLGLIDRDVTPGPRAARRRAGDVSRGGGRRAWAFAHSPGFTERLLRYLARLLAAVRVDELTGVARVALDDPADTGVLWGALAPLAAQLARRHPAFELSPSFTGDTHVEGRWRAHVLPLEVLGVTLAFALSPPTLRAAMAAWRAA